MVFALPAFNTIAQDSGDEQIRCKEEYQHLWPVDNSYGNYFMSAEVLGKKQIMSDDESVVLETIVYPYFSQAKIITILDDEKGHFRAALTFSKVEDLSKAKFSDIDTIYRPIKVDLVNNLSAIFEQVLIKTKYSVYNKCSSANDGEIHQFYVNGNQYGQMYGQTWSPKINTPPHILTFVTLSLEQYIKRDIDTEAFSKLVEEKQQNLKVLLLNNSE